MRRSLVSHPLRSLLLASVIAALPVGAATTTTMTYDGQVPEGGPDYFTFNFEVPPGTQEIEVRHSSVQSGNILDFGLVSPDGLRGWGGGNTEPAVVGVNASSRSYLTGLTPGAWKVVIGKARLAVTPAQYHLEIDFRDAPTLAAQPERKPYAPAAPLSTEARWYQGDLHVHSLQSGDANDTLDQLSTLAHDRGLDFVVVTDHNTVSQDDYLVDAQSRSPNVLLMPGEEVTTYSGHFGAIGVTSPVDFQVGLTGEIADFLKGANAAGGVVSINHPVLDFAPCIGCAWSYDFDPNLAQAVEIANGGLSESGYYFDTRAIAYWDSQLDKGAHLAALGGSDDHRAGVNETSFQSAIGDPTTLVYATELSAKGILDGIKAGRTVVKLQGPDDPMVELTTSSGAMIGDTVHDAQVTFKATVTRGIGTQVRLVKNGVAGEAVDVTSDPFTYVVDVTPPSTGTDRYRAEVVYGDAPRTVTSHLWVGTAETKPQSGGCQASPGTSSLALVFVGLALLWRRRSSSNVLR